MDLADLLSKQTEVEVNFDGSKVKVKYNPRKITPRFQSAFRKSIDADAEGSLAKALAAVLSGWDLTSKGKPYPLTEEALLDLPTEFLAAVMRTVTEDMNPNPSGSVSSEST